MKIAKVKWAAHPVLGDLELDFTDVHHAPYQNVLFAGENGAGKTTILHSINAFLNGNTNQKIVHIEYYVANDLYKIIFPNPVAGPAGTAIRYTYNLIAPDGSNQEISYYPTNIITSTDPNDAHYYGSVFSKARADYKTGPISGVTNQALDNKKSDEDREESFTNLKQLLVDIQSQDSLEYASKNQALGSSPLSWPLFYPNSRQYRFKNAFDNFFQNLSYHGVGDDVGAKNIFFDKGARKIPIDSLSTGEKQIVFRGVYLLRNIKNLEDATIFIDEPELSMHPKWQRKILDYYIQLFTSSGVPKSQLFFATHSDHVLKSALEDMNLNLVITLTADPSGVIIPKKIDQPTTMPTVTHAETNYLAFDMVTTDYHIELYGHLQAKTSTMTLKSCDELIEQDGHYSSGLHEKVSNHGSTVYKTLPTYIRNCIHHPDGVRTYDEIQLRTSIELLIKIIRSRP